MELLEAERANEEVRDIETRMIWREFGHLLIVFLEHLEELVFNRDEPELSAQYSSAIFKEPPVYSVLVSGTPENKQLTEVNELFSAKITSKGNLAEHAYLKPFRTLYNLNRSTHTILGANQVSIITAFSRRSFCYAFVNC